MSFDAAEIEIGRLNETDIDAVLGIAEVLAGAPHWPRKLYEEALRAESPRLRIALVAREPRGGGVAGFAIASLIPPVAELESIAVAANAQRQGIGGRLLTALAAELRRAGGEELLLEVRSSNLAAVRFYEAQNFKKTGARPAYYADPEEDALLMSLRLG